MRSRNVYRKVCQFCGQTFTAYTAVTRYCSKPCADNARKAKLRQEKLNLVTKQEQDKSLELFDLKFQKAEVLSPSTAAVYMGLSRMTIYRYMRCGLIPCIQMPGKTLIKKSDLDKLFESAVPYTRRENAARRRYNPQFAEEKKENKSFVAPDSKYMTVKEAAAKYGMCDTTVLKTIRKARLHGISFRNAWFYDRDEVDKVMKTRIEFANADITEWYTRDEIKQRYGMTDTAVWSMAYDHNIPKRRKGNKMLYSKSHVDAIKLGKK